MTEREAILQVGTEGGGLTLFGTRTGYGWTFSRAVRDQTPLLLDEPAIEHESAEVDSWPAALALLDRYPWDRFYPLDVHREFRARILAAVAERFRLRENPNAARFEAWEEACGTPAC